MKALLSVVIALVVYEVIARAGWFATALVPTLPMVARTLWAMLADGSMAGHAINTLYRVFAGLALAASVGMVLSFQNLRPVAYHPCTGKTFFFAVEPISGIPESALRG